MSPPNFANSGNLSSDLSSDIYIDPNNSGSTNVYLHDINVNDNGNNNKYMNNDDDIKKSPLAPSGSGNSDEVFDETDLDFPDYEIPTPNNILADNTVDGDIERAASSKDTLSHKNMVTVHDDEPENDHLDPVSKTFSIVKLSHDLPVDEGYSWVFMVLCCILSAFSWGVNSGYSVFLSYYLSNNFFPGATDMDYAFIGGFSFSMGFILSPVITIVMGKLGLRRSIFLGMCCQSGGLIAASFAKQIWQLYLSQGILQGIGLGFMVMPISIMTSHWFHKKKSLANGVISAGAGFGGIIFSLGGQALLDSLGLGWALRIIGMMTFVINTICLLFLRHRGDVIPTNYNTFSRSNLKIFKRPHVFFFCSWSAPTMMGYCILLYSLSAYTVSMGFTHSQGAIVGSLLQVSSALGRPAAGFFMDKIGCVNGSIFLGLYCSIVIFAIWVPATNIPLIYIFALMIGGPSSVVSVGVQPIGQDMAALDELPTLYAVVWTINGIFAIFSEVIGLKVRKFEWKYSFIFTQLFSGLTYLLGVVFMLHLREWKVQKKLSKEYNYLATLKARIDQHMNEKTDVVGLNGTNNPNEIIIDGEICDRAQIDAKIDLLQSILESGLKNRLARAVYKTKV